MLRSVFSCNNLYINYFQYIIFHLILCINNSMCHSSDTSLTWYNTTLIVDNMPIRTQCLLWAVALWVQLRSLNTVLILVNWQLWQSAISLFDHNFESTSYTLLLRSCKITYLSTENQFPSFCTTDSLRQNTFLTKRIFVIFAESRKKVNDRKK